MGLERQRRDYFDALEWVGGMMRATAPDLMGARLRARSSRYATWWGI